MISSVWVDARMRRPAVGADFSPDRLALAIENCGIVCQVLQSEGLRPLHHSHVGGVFETEQEICALLDQLGPDVLGFGPDTGHLRWAGIDPGPFVAAIRGPDRRHPPQGLLRRLPRRPPGGRPRLRRTERQPAALGGTGTRRRGLRRRAGRRAGRLRRRLHDRDRRAERRLAVRVAPHRLRLGPGAPAGMRPEPVKASVKLRGTVRRRGAPSPRPRPAGPSRPRSAGR